MELKSVFLNHYAGQGWHASQTAQLANIAMGYEQPSDYIGRIMQKAGQLGIRLDTLLDEGSKRMVRGWYYQLPHNVQQTMSAEMNAIYESGTIQLYLDAVQRHVPQKPDRVEPCPLYCPYCPSKVDFTCSCETMIRLNSKRKLPQGPKADKIGVKSTSVVTDEVKKPKSGVDCRKCGAPDWNYRHRCARSDRQVTGAILDPLEPTIPEVVSEWERSDLEELDDPALVSSAFSPRVVRNNRRPKLDLTLNGKLMKDLYVDTMSDITVLNHALLPTLLKGTSELRLNTLDLPKVVAANNTAMKFEGSIEIPVEKGGLQLTHTFLISKDLPKQINCLLGNDILGLLGVGFTGMESESTANQTTFSSVTASIVETIEGQEGKDLGLKLEEAISELEVCDDKTTSQYRDLLLTFRLRLREELDQSIEENQNLSGFCTHPSAEILFSTTDETPINVRQYDLPYKHRPVVDKQIQEWVHDGIVEECFSKDHSNNPLLVVPKRDIAGNIKDWRTCIDPRLINAKIIDSAYPIPKGRAIFDTLAGCEIYSIIDLKAGFNQIRVFSEHRKKTAFTWNKRIYQFVGAPFGFKNIPQDFQRIMNSIFADMDFVTIYLDDIVIGSSSYADHVRHVKAVIRRLTEVNLRLSPKKLKLAHDEIVVIGNKVSRYGVTVAIEKLEKMVLSTLFEANGSPRGVKNSTKNSLDFRP